MPLTGNKGGAVTSSDLTMSTARLLGRNTASTGAIEEITLGTNLSFSGTTLNATGGISGLTAARVPFASNSTTLVDDAGLTYDSTNKALTVGGATVTTSNPALVVNQTVNAGAVAFTLAKFNLTNTASAATSKVLDVQVNAASVMSVGVKGGLTLTPDQTTYSGATANAITVGTAPHGFAYEVNQYTALAGDDGGGWGTKLQINKYSRIQIPASYTLCWSTSSLTAKATVDTGLTRNAAGVVEVNNGTAGTFRDLKLRSLISSGGTITLSNYTVATLPTAASNTHAIVAVTDGNASPTYRGAVTGGGSTKGVVYCDGSSWMWH